MMKRIIRKLNEVLPLIGISTSLFILIDSLWQLDVLYVVPSWFLLLISMALRHKRKVKELKESGIFWIRKKK